MKKHWPGQEGNVLDRFFWRALAFLALVFLAGLAISWYKYHRQNQQIMAPFAPPLFSCKIIYQVGAVYKKSPGADRWTVVENTSLAAGDTLKTDLASRLHLVINGEKECVVPENRVAVISEGGVQILKRPSPDRDP